MRVPRLIALGACELWTHTALGAPAQHALDARGTHAAAIEALWWPTLTLCTIVFVALMTALAAALWRARKGRIDAEPDLHGLETVEPGPRSAVVVGVVLSAAGLVGLIVASVLTDRALAQHAGGDALEIEVNARQWWWEARYLDADPTRIFTTANELHIPTGRTVRLALKSEDVIHSFWLPNLHGKRDLIPGRTATLELHAESDGTYRGQCAEFCGFQHARMAFLVTAAAQSDYQRWAEQQRRPAPEPSGESQLRGRDTFMSRTCVMCHAIQGTPAQGRNGPDLTHVASRRTLAAGTLANTRGNLAAWIVDPQSIKPGANMPPTALSAEELQSLLDYLETLK